MVYQESETVELKSVVVDDIRKEIIAFANCEGGKLYIGVQDDGTVVGLDEPDGSCGTIMAGDENAGKQTVQNCILSLKESFPFAISAEKERKKREMYSLSDWYSFDKQAAFRQKTSLL